MRLIDADKVKVESRKHCVNCKINGTKHCKTCVVNLICDRLDLQPTVEPQRPQGEWIFDSEFTEFGNPYGTYRCDKCGGHSSNKYPFCFWCGAEMKGGAE